MTAAAPVRRIRDLFDLPERVVRNDFVVKLHDGIKDEQQTIDTYVVTENLLKAFRQVFGILSTALTSGTSQGAYLHGSFGAGKSHFMAVLDLLLADRPAAWRKTAFHELRAKHTWIGQKKLLVLPVHCVNARSLEDRLFEDYVAWVREHHPDAPPPPVFRDQELFDMARRALAEQGDEVFFRILNRSTQQKTGLARAVAQREGGWTRERFEAATASNDPAARKRLFDALTTTHYPAFVKGDGHFLPLGPGLQALSQHAKELGYDGVLLLLDEVILWLATLKADETRLATEVQKISTLVETSKHPRAIPIVSLLARQRGLRELLGESALGATWAAIDEQLSYWKERFETIELPDTEFPRILRERVLRPKDTDAARALDAAFAAKRRALSLQEWDLLRGDYTEDDFRRVYPFSPALVDVLVRLSGALQRERTAMRIVTDLLVNHVGDLQVGSIVPLGDLYDLLALEETRDPVLNQRFHAARLAYRGRLLPAIHRHRGTGETTRCQRIREGHDPTLGCSGCPEKDCRNDNRIAKTLLLSAIAHDVPSLARLDVRKLSQLNHGVITSLLPNGAASAVHGLVRTWVNAGATISLGTGENPQVELRLDAVDIEPVLQQAGAVDNYGARQGLVRKLLLAQFGIDAKDPTFDYDVVWRGIRRRGQIQFANVRTLTPSAFHVPHGCDWQIVIDFPFDERNKSPQDDLARIEEFRERGEKAWTMVWLPSFFHEEINQDALGKLVRVTHIDDAPDEYLRAFSGPDRERARAQVTELRRVLTERVVLALEVAYGVRTATEANLIDVAATIEPHTHPLNADAASATFARHTLASALEEQVDALLSACFPGHPDFKRNLTAKPAGRVAELLGRLIDQKDRGHQEAIRDKTDLGLLRDVAEPFGLVRLRDELAILQTDPLEKIRKAALREDADAPTVAQVARWAEGDRPMGLEPVARDLLVDVYARWVGATIYETGGLYGERPIDPIPHGKLPNSAVLRQAELPSPDAWNAALELAGVLWGTKLAGRSVTAKNLSDLGREIATHTAAWVSAEALVEHLERTWAAWGDATPCDRLTTARSSARFVETLREAAPLDAVSLLATAKLQTSSRAVARSLASAPSIADALSRPALFAIFEPVRKIDADWAKKLLEQVREALRADELNTGLLARLQELQATASTELGRLVQQKPLPPVQPDPEPDPPEPTPPPGPDRERDKAAPPRSGQVRVRTSDMARSLDQLRAAWTEALRSGREIEVQWKVLDDPPPGGRR